VSATVECLVGEEGICVKLAAVGSWGLMFWQSCGLGGEQEECNGSTALVQM
jgi:hypothetical protein